MTPDMKEYLLYLLTEDLAEAVREQGAHTILTSLREKFPVEWDSLVSACHHKPKKQVAALLQKQC